VSSLRVGIGYDSHRFAEPGDDRPLILGGVEIPHDRGLAGYSDATVATRAVVDALVGATGHGDIGTHFPPDSAEWKDADSLDLLRRVLDLLEGKPVNVDLTVVAETPRLSDLRQAIAESLTAAVCARFNLKATTNEGMGWIGRAEGIACSAVALVETGQA